MRKELCDGEQVFVIHDFLTPAECDRFIAETERHGYAAAPITTAAGPVMAADIRNNDRVMLDNFDWAADLWPRAQPFIPSPLDGRPAIGLNERFRFYRYREGQTFRPHTDGCFARNDARSFLTFMVYLSGGISGGETLFWFTDDEGIDHKDGDVLRIEPAVGKALVFRHELTHEGAPVRHGTKYVLRTDVMYRT